MTKCIFHVYKFLNKEIWFLFTKRPLTSLQTLNWRYNINDYKTLRIYIQFNNNCLVPTLIRCVEIINIKIMWMTKHRSFISTLRSKTNTKPLNKVVHTQWKRFIFLMQTNVKRMHENKGGHCFVDNALTMLPNAMWRSLIVPSLNHIVVICTERESTIKIVFINRMWLIQRFQTLLMPGSPCINL